MTKSEFIASIILLNCKKINRNTFLKPGNNQITVTADDKIVVTLIGRTEFKYGYSAAFKWLLANDKK